MNDFLTLYIGVAQNVAYDVKVKTDRAAKAILDTEASGEFDRVCIDTDRLDILRWALERRLLPRKVHVLGDSKLMQDILNAYQYTSFDGRQFHFTFREPGVFS